MPWTPEQIDQLRALAPLSSPLEISRILGMTKNAVMGKMHRLGIAIRDARKPRPILRSPTEILREREARLRHKSQAVIRSNKQRGEAVWTPDRIALLRLMAPGGTGAIAQTLGCSKASVKAKSRRLGISIGRPKLGLRGESAMMAKVMRPVKVVLAPPRPPVEVVEPPPAAIEIELTGVDFAGLKRHSCRYPVKCDHNGFIRLYCGESARPESSWCGFHEKVVWLPAFERRRA